MRDVIVIGSGISGLGAALQLARNGRSVTLLESQSEAGGLIKLIKQDGYSFDVGLQYVGQAREGETFTRFLEQLGVEIAFREFAPDCLERYVFPSFETRLVRGREAQEALFRHDFPGEARGLRWFFDVVQALDVLLGGVVGERRRPLNPLKTLRLLPELMRATRTDIRTFLQPHIREPRLIAALSCFIGDVALPPSRASAMSILIDWAHFLGGAFYPVGGGGGLVEAFLQAMAPLDVALHTSSVVERIEPGAPFYVTLSNGERLSARSVISCVDATTSLGWVQGEKQPTRLSQARTFAPSLAAYGAFLGVTGDLRDLGLTEANLWHYEHDDLETLFEPLLQSRESEHLALYFCSPSLKDPGTRRAPVGHQALTVLAWAPMTGQFGEAPPPESPERIQARVDDLLWRAERVLPGLKERIAFRKDVSPATTYGHARARQGGFYGAAMSPEQSLPNRFLPTTGIDGFYLAGASIFGCGVLPGLLSGRIAALLADRHLQWRRVSRQSLPPSGHAVRPLKD